MVRWYAGVLWNARPGVRLFRARLEPHAISSPHAADRFGAGATPGCQSMVHKGADGCGIARDHLGNLDLPGDGNRRINRGRSRHQVVRQRFSLKS